MAEYESILKFLASNPPRREQEKKIHASLLEMLAKKLRKETANFGIEALNNQNSDPISKRRYN
ncbi:MULTISPECIES: hypothetical protein [Rhodomicrobium]|uniref:hypothetical protein n=1 Tax=Rhodomicrobium TaxID=1068 RepID=UPI000F73B6F8|nr:MULTISPECIES: hypothetical protein [Rhodomicrobium]